MNDFGQRVAKLVDLTLRYAAFVQHIMPLAGPIGGQVTTEWLEHADYITGSRPFAFAIVDDDGEDRGKLAPRDDDTALDEILLEQPRVD